MPFAPFYQMFININSMYLGRLIPMLIEKISYLSAIGIERIPSLQPKSTTNLSLK